MLRRDQYGRKKKPRGSAAILANALAQAGQDEQLQRIFNDGALAAPPGSTYDQAPAGPQFPHLQGAPRPMGRPAMMPQPPGQPDPLQDGALMAAPMFPSLGGGQVEPVELPDFEPEEPEFEAPEVSVTAPRDFTPSRHGPPGPPEQENGFMQRVGRWMQPGSPTAMSLLSAGLGILANNTGHYGQAGPAIGKGGLMGVNTFLQLQQQAKQEEFRRAQMTGQDEYRKAQLAGQAEQRELYKRQVQAQTMAQERAAQAEARKMQAEERKLQAAQSFRASLPEADQRMFDADPDEFMKTFVKDRESGRVALLREEALKIAGDNPEYRAFAISAPEKFIEYVATLRGDIEKRKAGATNVTQNVDQREIDKEAMKSLAEGQKIQRKNEDALYSVLDAEAILDKGIYSGKWSDIKRGVEKGAGAIFGTDTTKASNTEEFLSHIGNLVIPRLVEFGGNDSEEELRYLREVMAGNVEMEEKTLRNILKKVQRDIRRGIQRHNEDLGRVGGEVRLPGNMRPVAPPQSKPSGDDWAPPPGITR